MSEFDLHSNVDSRSALTLVDADTVELGSVIDTSGFESIEFVIHAHDLNVGTFAVTLEEDDDAGFSTPTSVSEEETLGDLPAFENTDDDTTKRVGSIGKKRYQRLTLTGTGTTTENNFSAIAILGNPHTAPVPQ